MSDDPEKVRRAALQLPIADRASLAAELLASLDGEPDADVEAAWAAEIERRVRKLERDGSQGRDWNAVLDELSDPR